MGGSCDEDGGCPIEHREATWADDDQLKCPEGDGQIEWTGPEVDGQIH